ncbi:MAG: acyl transferase [Saprospiraceae bacterium]|nr:acyl transferase [Saprospiraceae bacterium]
MLLQNYNRADILSSLKEVSADNFDEVARQVFEYQLSHNQLYSTYCSLLDKRETPEVLSGFPFLPIQFFKTYIVKSGFWPSKTIFTSSGTTGQLPSQHHVRSRHFYLDNARRGFTERYGKPEKWCILALLPSYLEREGSSLVAMADDLIKRSRYAESGFFLHDFDKLKTTLLECQAKGYPTLLLGVSFALLDFAEKHPVSLSGITIMETGGMKGRRREMTRAELHETLRTAFQVDTIHSEYGMTELLSQAYASGGRFWPVPTLRVIATEINDPFCPVAPGRTGQLNIIDLANLDTCSFIATDDLGRVYDDGSFEVLGRLDSAELRGCNLMVE